jgi:hypothetical protein
LDYRACNSLECGYPGFQNFYDLVASKSTVQVSLTTPVLVIDGHHSIIDWQHWYVAVHVLPRFSKIRIFLTEISVQEKSKIPKQIAFLIR